MADKLKGLEDARRVLEEEYKKLDFELRVELPKEIDTARQHRAVQPAGDLVEVAADAPDGQHERRIDAGDRLATAGLGKAKRLA